MGWGILFGRISRGLAFVVGVVFGVDYSCVWWGFGWWCCLLWGVGILFVSC